MTLRKSAFKAMVVAGMLAVAGLGGIPQQAQALTFGAGDAVLVLYGNNTEYVKNLGSFSSLLTNGVDLDLSSILPTLLVNTPDPVNPIEYTIVGNNSATSIFFGNSFAASTWTTAQRNAVGVNNYVNALANWSGPLGLAADPAKTLYGEGEALSFSTNLNAANSDTLGGSIPATRRGSADIGTILQLLQRDGTATSLTTVGTAFLNQANGHFVVSAVPVPAAVVLFATGVIGLVGLARRRMSGAHPDAA